MARKIHMKDAEAQGFTIDTCCNPPIAYKGPRFRPTALFECFTEAESALMGLVPVMQKLSEAGIPGLSDKAQEVLKALPKDVVSAVQEKPELSQDSPVRPKFLGRVQHGDMYMVRTGRMSTQCVMWSEPFVAKLHVQRDPSGEVCLLALQDVDFAEFDPRHDAEEDDKFVTEDYALEILVQVFQEEK